MKVSPNSEVEEFLKKIDFSSKDWCFVVDKHNGEKFIHNVFKDGKYDFWRLNTDEHVNDGSWKIDGQTYMLNNDSQSKGRFEITGESEFIIHCYFGEHGYHKLTPTSNKYTKG